jgi:cytochrome c peroxidase
MAIALAHWGGLTARRTAPIGGVTRSPFLFWDGRKDSLWAQAHGPLKRPVEHGGTRAHYAHVVANSYAREYEQIFGALPDLAGASIRRPGDRSRGRVGWSALTDAQRDAVTRVFVTSATPARRSQ